MSVDPAAELVRFQQFIGAQLAKGDTLSPEEALDLWRIEHPNPEECAGTVQAVREALADMDAGDSGVPLAEFERTFRQRHGLSS